ncbi:MAG: UDP-N-acetylmuramate dehydrogenase [Patescibacteria group bacterium]
MVNAITKKLPGVKRGEVMSRHTTYRIGGPADYFYTAKTTNDLISAITLARQHQLPVFLLGKGSNILVADAGVRGLVIQVETNECTRNGDRVTVAAGYSLGALVQWTIEQGLAGLEFASGIPGSVGGAVRGNAGAFGSETKDVIESIEILTSSSERRVLSKTDCQFGYRDSLIKHTPDIVLSATFHLHDGNRDDSRALVKKYMDQRTSKQDYSIPSAGSVFKNPPGNFAAKMIDELGLKGMRIGDAQISLTHANFIVNVGQAKANDVLQLISSVKEKVKAKYTVELETEIQLVGF